MFIQHTVEVENSQKAFESQCCKQLLFISHCFAVKSSNHQNILSDDVIQSPLDNDNKFQSGCRLLDS